MAITSLQEAQRMAGAAYSNAFSWMKDKAPDQKNFLSYWTNRIYKEGADISLRDQLRADPMAGGVYKTWRESQKKQTSQPLNPAKGTLSYSGNFSLIKPTDVTAMPSPNEGSKMLGKVLGANIPFGIDPGIAGLLNIYNKQTKEEKDVESIQKNLLSSMKQLGGMSEEMKKQLEKQGVPKMYEQMKQLNLRAAQLTGNLEKFDVETQSYLNQIENQPISMTAITGQQAQAQKLRSIERLGMAAELSSTIALNQAYQGNAELGIQLAQQAVDMKYQPILNEIEVYQTQLGYATDKMNRAETKIANTVNALLDIRKTQIQEEKQKALDIEEMAIEAATNGAPLDIINTMRGATNRVQAAQIAAQYLGQGVITKNQIMEYASKAALAGAPDDVLEKIKNSTDIVEAAKLSSPYLTVDEQKQSIIDLAADAAANGASQEVVNRMKEAKDIADAAVIGSSYLKGSQESNRSNSGPPSEEKFEFTAANVKTLLGAGFTQDEIRTIEQNIQNGFGAEDIINNSEGVSRQQKNALYSVFPGVTEDTSYITKDWWYENYSQDELNKMAIDNGFKTGGSLWWSKGDIEKFLDSIMQKIELLRDQGLNDDKILEKLAK